MNVSLTRFLLTGVLGELHPGLSKEAVQSLLGPPDTTGGTSCKYPQPSILLYGTVELGFRQARPYDLVSIWWDAGEKGPFQLSPLCAVTEWAFRPDWTFEQVEDYLRENDLPFSYQNPPSPDDLTPTLAISSGVIISFQGGLLYGIYGWRS